MRLPNPWGKTLEIQNMNFDGALLAVQQGKADFAAAGISVTEKTVRLLWTLLWSMQLPSKLLLSIKSSDKVKSAEDITSDTTRRRSDGDNVADSYCTDEMECEVKQYQKFA